MKKITDKMRIDWLIKMSPNIYFYIDMYPKWGDIQLTRRGLDAAIRKEKRGRGRKK